MDFEIKLLLGRHARRVRVASSPFQPQREPLTGQASQFFAVTIIRAGCLHRTGPLKYQVRKYEPRGKTPVLLALPH